MRSTLFLLCILAVGCGSQSAGPVAEDSHEGLPPAIEEAPAGQDPTPTPGVGGAEASARVPPPPPSRGEDWPRFLGPLGNSISRERGIIKPWPREGLKIVWRTPLGEGYGMPVIQDGKLYVFDRHGDTARLTCLESATGKFVWKFEYPTKYEDIYGYSGGPRCCPVVEGDRVYIFGPEGMLHCIGTADGKPLWKLDTKAEFGVVQNFFGVGSTPVIEGDLLITQIGGSPKGSEEIPFDKVQGNGTGVVAFDKMTGKVRWKASDELASYSSPVLTTIGDRRWCFVFARGGLVALDPANGKVDFHFPWRAKAFESVNASNPVVVGNKVLITECYGPGSAFLRVGPDKPTVIWSDEEKPRNKSLQCHWNTPVERNGYVYGSSGRHTGEAELRCVDITTGKVMWSKPDMTRCSLLLVDDHFICLGEYGQVWLLKVNPEKYEEVSAMELSDESGRLLQYPCWAAPILSHGLLYLRGKDQLVCLELIPKR